MTEPPETPQVIKVTDVRNVHYLIDTTDGRTLCVYGVYHPLRRALTHYVLCDLPNHNANV